MDTNRLHSYFFNCPCCDQLYLRSFEYYAKFYGFIPEDVPLSSVHNEVSVYERVVLDEDNYVGRSVGVGDSTFRCGKCNEFFKFNDTVSQPVKLTVEEKEIAYSKFKPITMLRETAIKNAFDMLVKMTANRGYHIDAEKGEISFVDASGKEYSFKIAEELINTFYADNANFKVQPYNLAEEYLKNPGMV